MVFAVGSTYLFYVANSGLRQDPLAIMFGAIDAAWRWLKVRLLSLFRRRRPA